MGRMHGSVRGMNVLLQEPGKRHTVNYGHELFGRHALNNSFGRIMTQKGSNLPAR